MLAGRPAHSPTPIVGNPKQSPTYAFLTPRAPYAAMDLAPAAFVKRVHEVLPDLRSAAMEAVIYTFISSRRKEE